MQQYIIMLAKITHLRILFNPSYSISEPYVNIMLMTIALVLRTLDLVHFVVSEFAVEALHVREHTLPVRFLHANHVLHIEERGDIRTFPATQQLNVQPLDVIIVHKL